VTVAVAQGPVEKQGPFFLGAARGAALRAAVVIFGNAVSGVRKK